MNGNDKKFIPVITYLNPDRDQEILDWLDIQPNRSATIREILQGHLQSKGAIPPGSGPEIQINPDNIRAVVTEALVQHLDLSMLRQLMESVINTALTKLVVASLELPAQGDENNKLLAGLDNDLFWD